MMHILCILIMLGTLVTAVPRVWSAESAYRSIALAREGGRITARRAGVQRTFLRGSPEMRWDDFFQRMWLPPLGRCQGEAMEGNPEEISLVDAGRPPLRVSIEVSPIAQMTFAGQGATVCAVVLRGVALEGGGRVLIEDDGLRPLASSLRLTRRLLPSPWDAAQGAAPVTREIEAAWSVIP